MTISTELKHAEIGKYYISADKITTPDGYNYFITILNTEDFSDESIDTNAEQYIIAYNNIIEKYTEQEAQR